MRILILGDLHEELPENFNWNLVEKTDLIILNGDLIDLPLRDILMEVREVGKELWEIFDVNEINERVKNEYNIGKDILKKLCSHNKPILIIPGNNECQGYVTDVNEPKELRRKFFDEMLQEFRDANVQNIHHNPYQYNDFTFIGNGLLSCGEQLLEGAEENVYEKILNDFEKSLERVDSNNLIFVYHIPPYGFFDLVLYPKSHRYMQNIGSKKELELILKYKPKLVITGHMHEYKGYVWINNETLILHPGFRNYVLLEVNERKIKIIEFP